MCVSSKSVLGLIKETKLRIHSRFSNVLPFKILDSDSKLLRGSLSKPMPSIASKRFVKDLHKLILCRQRNKFSHIKSPSDKCLTLLTRLCHGDFFFFMYTHCDWNVHSMIWLRISVFFLQSTNDSFKKIRLNGHEIWCIITQGTASPGVRIKIADARAKSET